MLHPSLSRWSTVTVSACRNIWWFFLGESFQHSSALSLSELLHCIIANYTATAQLERKQVGKVHKITNGSFEKIVDVCRRADAR